MSAPRTPTNQFMLLFRGTDWYRGLSAEQVQHTMTEWYAWFDGLLASGEAVTGHPLAPEGKVVSGKKGSLISDGPFAEAKESIGGYFLLTVPTEERALEIAQACPALEFGLSVEVRPVVAMCDASEAGQVSHDYAEALA